MSATRESRALWASHLFFVLLTLAVAYRIYTRWQPVLGSAA